MRAGTQCRRLTSCAPMYQIKNRRVYISHMQSIQHKHKHVYISRLRCEQHKHIYISHMQCIQHKHLYIIHMHVRTRDVAGKCTRGAPRSRRCYKQKFSKIKK